MNQPKSLRVLSVAGGKGGVGKTTVSINLAVSFAKLRHKTLLLDADLGLANVDVLLGLQPKKTVHDFLSGQCELEEVFLNGPHGLKIVPAASGVQKMVELSLHESAGLIHSFSELDEDLDVMLIDLAAGISSQVMDLTHAAQDVLLVICNDPASLMDSYAVIKILHQKYLRQEFGIVVNKVKHSIEAEQVFLRFQETVTKFMPVQMKFLGAVPADDYLTMATRECAPVVDKYPHSPSALAFQEICLRLNEWQPEKRVSGGIHFLFEKIIQGRQLVEQG